MATFYVRTDGSDSNTGTGPGTGQAWATVGKAVSATGMSSGDTVYVAPGVYSSIINVLMTSATAPTYIIGDPLATQFSGVSAGQVICTNYNTALTASGFANHVVAATSKNFLHWSNINFKFNPPFGISTTTVQNWSFTKCTFSSRVSTNTLIGMSSPASTAMSLTINQCIFHGGSNGLSLVGGGVPDTTSIRNSIFRNCATGITQVSCQTAVFNCLFLCSSFAINQGSQSLVFPATITNSLCANSSVDLIGGTTGWLIETYNRLLGTQARSNVAQGTGSVTVGDIGFDIGESLLQGLPNIAQLTSFLNSPNANFGTLTGAPATDIYGNTWTGPNPDAGAGTYKVLSSAYSPTERNAGVITIAPGSTSQSIELYLGVTGLTSSSAGLSARYNRTRTASVSIPLVARTIAQAWTAGGFAEVDATNMPGVYRLDIPAAALAAGADDVTIVVRGASGTNGAVMTVKLSSGGLTEAQTASAVWGASPAGYNDATTFGGVVNQIDQTVTGTSTLVQDIPSNVWQEETNDHTTHGTYGYNILRADAPSKEGLVTLHQSGGISRIDADIHAIVNDTAAAAELKGALLHTGGDYITADLLNPVASAQTLRIGPFGVRADGGGADGALDLNQSTAANIVVQMTDGQGTGIDQTSATVQAKVYNVAGALVATYTCTAAYALGGYMSIPMTTTVTGTAGSYIINLWSTVGSTVTVYGPLQLRVRAI